MDAKIIKTNENAILGRKEIIASVSFDKATPNRKEMKELVCGKIGANPDSTVVREVKSKFGTRGIDAVLHVYASKDAALAAEPGYILIREGMAEKKPKKEKKKTTPAAAKK